MNHPRKLSQLLAVGLVGASVLGCATDTTKKAAATGAKAQFNYVPLNDKACVMPADDAGLITVGRKLNTLAHSYRSAVAVDLRVCDTCSDDKFEPLLNSVTQDVNIGGAIVKPPLLALVNHALVYPYRDLLVSWSVEDDGKASVVLSQGTQVGDPNGNAYEIKHESLATDCAAFNNVVSATAKTTVEPNGNVERTAITTADPGANGFGFIVPTELPDVSGTPQTIAAALAHMPGLNVRVGKPEVNVTVDAHGEGRGTIAGWIEPGQLQAISDAGADLTPFIDDGSGSIRVVLSFKLVPATLKSEIDPDHILHNAAVADDGSATTGKLTSDHPLPKPDSMGAVADCPDCDSDEKRLSQGICGGKTQIGVPVDILRVNGSTEKFNLQVLDKAGKPLTGWYPQIVEKNLLGGTVDGPKTHATKEEFKFTRAFRHGMLAHPACADLLTKGSPLQPINAARGWMEIGYRPTNGKQSGCTRKLLVCQDFNGKVCGENSGMNLNGTCECAQGFRRAFDQCVKISDYPNCPLEAMLSKTLKGPVKKGVAPVYVVSCTCPKGSKMDKNNKCAAVPPCMGENACKKGELCVPDSDGSSELCVPHDKEFLTAANMAKNSAAVGKTYDLMVLGKADGVGGKNDDPTVEHHDFEGGGALGDPVDDTDDQKADAVANKGTQNLTKKPSLSHVLSLSFLGETNTVALKADLSRKVDGKALAAAAFITSMRMRNGDLHDLTINISAANYNAFMDKMNGSPGVHKTIVAEFDQWNFNPHTRKYSLGYHNSHPTAYKVVAFHVAPHVYAGCHFQVRLAVRNAHAGQLRSVYHAPVDGHVKIVTW